MHEKKQRDRLIGRAKVHPDWVLGFLDEVWWSRIARPHLASWVGDGSPLRLIEQTVARGDPDPKALACYGLLVRHWQGTGERDEGLWLRFVEGRPVSAITTQFLAWCCDRLAAQGKTALLLVWDNASWHISKAVRGGLLPARCRRRVRGSTQSSRNGCMANGGLSSLRGC
jgi:hypothetical protein